jgi:transposase
MPQVAATRTELPPDWAAERAQLQGRISELEQQLAWFKRQLFGEKSERRTLEPPPSQLSLGEDLQGPQPDPEASQPIAAHQRRRTPKTETDEPRLFFDETQVPVETITVPNPELEGLEEGEYERIGEKVTHRLAQRPGSYVILKYMRPLIKRKDTESLHCPAAPPAVLEGGRADVSFLAGLLIDKFLYHLPLYRQHQRLAAAGITVSRQWLTQQVLAVALLLAPIVAAQLAAIRACRVKAMDETPIKAGRKGKGKLKSGPLF